MTTPFDPPATTPVPVPATEPARPAEPLDRVNAWLLDRGASMAAFAAACLIGPLLAVVVGRTGHRELIDVGRFLVLVPLVGLGALQTWWLATTGQTLGRRLHAIRVVDERGGPAPPGILVAQALFRTVARHLLLFGVFWFLGNLVPSFPDGQYVDFAELEAQAARGRLVGLALTLAGAGPILLDLVDLRDGQALHDRLLRTRVVRDPTQRAPQPAPHLRYALIVALAIAITICLSLP